MSEKIKYWWSEDRQWFCILVNDGASQATVSLSIEEAEAFMGEVMIQANSIASEKVCDHPSTEKAAWLLLPRALTAENGAKAALIGEFSESFDYMDEEGDECQAEIPVSWTTIKAIWKAAVAHFEAAPPAASLIANPENLHGRSPPKGYAR